MKVPDLEVKKTLYVGEGDPSLVLGKGPLQIRGGSYVEGPAVFGSIPPFFIDFEGSGMTLSISTSEITPNPLHFRQAPYGELNENKFGSGSAYEMPVVGHIKKRLKGAISPVS